MQTNTTGTRSIRSKRTSTIAGAIALCIGALAACNANPAPGSSAYREGELGNGDFLFACDDGAACLPYSGDAAKFPAQIATGSNFDVRFVSKKQQGNVITIDDKRYEGIVTEPVGPYVGKGPDGFSALKPGYGTIMVHDSKGTIIDYVTLKIVQPNDLIIYEAAYDVTLGKEPPRVPGTVSLKVGSSPQYRVVAEYAAEPAAGSIPVKWESRNEAVVEVSYSRGVVNLHAKGQGSADVVATGAALEKVIHVEVTQ